MNKKIITEKELIKENLDRFIIVFGAETVAEMIYEEILAPLGW